MSNRTPGKLNVGAVGGKLNNLLLAGPPAKPASRIATSEPRKPTCLVTEKISFSTTVSPKTVTGGGSLKKTPVKLNVGAIGDKLNNILLSGPPGMKPKLAGKTEKPAEKVQDGLIGVLKARPRGPANRRPMTRSMVMTSSFQIDDLKDAEKNLQEPSETDPVHF
ncbi:unnamed protein product [Caenorhabditis bovis]|uniref:Uncharacterized protein n=1 Tax=Caenorhabditis bovis TaxID=2654633 RepID=A0A8S1EGZ6_9PELO|nr:unnamed protein product [Caenorhabditis bovis]